MQQKNFLLFIVLSFLIFIAWMDIKRRIWPPPPPQTEAERPPKNPGLGLAAGPIALMPGVIPPPPIKPNKPIKLPSRLPPTTQDKLQILGTRDRKSKTHLYVKLDPRGAGIRLVVLNKFQEASALGTPVWENKEERIPELLELVPDEANQDNPSFQLLLYDPAKPTDDRPLDTLGKRDWTVEQPAEREVLEDGKERWTVTFRTKDMGLVIHKKYTLIEQDYHIGLEVTIEVPKDGEEKQAVRYQLTGAHGLPIEGRWYTGVFRNALIALEEKGAIYRELQDARQIDFWGGGNEVVRGKGQMIRYAGVAVQYFASMIVVDENQEKQDFLQRARPTLETAAYRGTVQSVSEDGHSMVLLGPDNKESTFLASPEHPLLFRNLKPKLRVAVVYSIDSRLRAIASEVAPETSIQPLWEDDPTVRVMTEPVRLKPGASVTHSYLLYNGPVKPSLLAQQKGAAAVPEAVVERYVHTLKLNTLTDYPSSGIGWFFSKVYLTELVIHCTNLMHTVLGWLNALLHSYGLSIIVLTVLVRGIMFPLSRKQALMSVRMQALMPEMKAMQEKYKNDRPGMVQAQMELYRRHNINPFGTCWVLMLQMPVFMGLYFALQESITFRLAPFWPTWIINLAAPDMLFYWGEGIPWISRPEDYGGFLYLGPFFNLLPVIAVVLMLMQQKMMTPPPTDEQQATQQKIMKWMMVLMGLFFYKVAAGLCIYFIVSSLWGFAERKMLPKSQTRGLALAGAGAGASATVSRPAGSSTAVTSSASVTGVTNRSLDVQDGRGRKGKAGRSRRRAGPDEPDEEPKGLLGRLGNWFRTRRKRLGDWWAEVLKQAEKK